MDKKEIVSLLGKIKKAKKEDRPDKRLSNGCYYLDDDHVYVGNNLKGDACHPYSVDGLTLKAYGSGYINISESNFSLVPQTLEGKESYLAFYLGLKNKKGLYDVYSLTGVNDTYLGVKEERYVVFSSIAAYYIRKINGILSAIKVSVTTDKKILYSLYVENQSKKRKDVYLSSYQNYMCMHSCYESEETKWFRDAHLTSYGALLHGVEDMSLTDHRNNYAIIKRATDGEDIQATTSSIAYRGNKNGQLCNSLSLENGAFPFEKKATGFSESAIYGDIVKKSLGPKESLSLSYLVEYAFSSEEAEKRGQAPYSLSEEEGYFASIKKAKRYLLKNPFKISFGSLKFSSMNPELLNNFLNFVTKQVDYCALSKNSTVMMLGIRDVFQMLEASLLWSSKDARRVIVQTLNYIAENGRAPRQYSLADASGRMALDTREFIDQVQWIISTLYEYVAFSGDSSILFEKCGFIEIHEGWGQKVEKRTTVLDHLKRMVDYLIANIDPETKCLRTLFGDWNDAVNGLGHSSDPAKKFGNGVSIMASEHLYKNLKEAIALFSSVPGNEDYVASLEKAKEEIASAVIEKAIVSDSNGKKKILHGWGEDASFYVGSFCDVDGKSRYSSNVYSFYAVSGLNAEKLDMSPTILEAFESLDSKYGIRTFDEYFSKYDDAWKVGRIINLPKGTAENAATYIHGTVFALRALFLLGEGEKATKQLEKILPFTHQSISTSPFIMSNSYGYNEDLGVDGESMNDWYTGSSNTLLKAIVFDCFGLRPEIGDEVKIAPMKDFIASKASLDIKIKGKMWHLVYEDSGKGQREIRVNGVPLLGDKIDLSAYKAEKEILVSIQD